jgi:hypothetical protein
MTPVLGPFSRALRRGAIDNRNREGRFLAAARHRLVQHLGDNPSTTQLVLVDRIAWLMLHCFLLDQRIASGENWGENDRKCYLANSLVRSLREIGHEASARRTPTLAEVLKACCVIDAPRPLDFFAKLRWLDGRPLLDTVEAYRQAIFETVKSLGKPRRPRLR